jgi:hypothetical protein
MTLVMEGTVSPQDEGILSVRDIPGEGCVFTVDLPHHSIPAPAAL